MPDLFWYDVVVPVGLPSRLVSDAELVGPVVAEVVAAGAAERVRMQVAVGAPRVETPVGLPPESVRSNAVVMDPSQHDTVKALVRALVGPYVREYMVDPGFHAWVTAVARSLAGQAGRVATGEVTFSATPDTETYDDGWLTGAPSPTEDHSPGDAAGER